MIEFIFAIETHPPKIAAIPADQIKFPKPENRGKLNKLQEIVLG